jgi:hypothetical protein
MNSHAKRLVGFNQPDREKGVTHNFSPSRGQPMVTPFLGRSPRNTECAAFSPCRVGSNTHKGEKCNLWDRSRGRILSCG